MPVARTLFRSFTSSSSRHSVNSDLPEAPIVDPAQKYKAASAKLHDYGTYLTTCLPKYIQKFSVWKDELTIMVDSTAITPIMTFLRDHTAAVIV